MPAVKECKGELPKSKSQSKESNRGMELLLTRRILSSTRLKLLYILIGLALLILSLVTQIRISFNQYESEPRLSLLYELSDETTSSLSSPLADLPCANTNIADSGVDETITVHSYAYF